MSTHNEPCPHAIRSIDFFHDHDSTTSAAFTIYAEWYTLATCSLPHQDPHVLVAMLLDNAGLTRHLQAQLQICHATQNTCRAAHLYTLAKQLLCKSSLNVVTTTTAPTDDDDDDIDANNYLVLPLTMVNDTAVL